MEKSWNPGEQIVLRGIYAERVWSARAVRIVKDTPSETILALLPGAQCFYPTGYFLRKQGDFSLGDRWQEALSLAWTQREFEWQWHRVLMFLRPNQFYKTSLVWDHASDQFKCYYINFQLPYVRTTLGFDTLDLDLDIVVNPQYAWHWIDEADYQEAIRSGGIQEAWARGIEQATPDVLQTIEQRIYPLDGSWQSWRPVQNWEPAKLPSTWTDYRSRAIE